MRHGTKWMIGAPVCIIGLGVAGFLRVPTLDGGEASAATKDTVARNKTSAKSDDVPWLIEPQRLKATRSARAVPRTTVPKSVVPTTKVSEVKVFRGAPRTQKHAGGQNRILRAAAKLPGAATVFPEPADERIPARGPETGKTVNPSQPIPTYRKSVGAQDASLTVDWVTPESIVVRQQEKFDLVLRNRGRIAIKRISITNVLPKGFRFIRAEPAPTKMGPKPSWFVKKLEPQQEARISLYLIPSAVGDAESHARVDFHLSSTATFKVVEPKLQIVAEGPKTALVGNQAVFNTTITNPGSGKATRVRMKAFLPKGLEATAKGSVYDLGILNAGESRSVRVLAKVTEMGDHRVTFVAIADGNLRDTAAKEVTGISPRLEVAVSGPRFRYLARPANYKVRVKNTGNAPAKNVMLNCRVPRAFAYLSGGTTGRFDASSKTINWFVGTLEVGKSVTAEFKLKAVNRGNFPILAQATSDRGLVAKDKHTTRVEGIAAILLEVVDVDDPVEVGAETYYEILVTNQGTEFAKNIRISAVVPDGIKLLSSTGPSRSVIKGRTIKFLALPKLAPRADAIYRIKVRTEKAGDLRIEARATSDSLRAPVTELESTKVYQD
ncbi:MAG: hypothetical protein ACE5KM_07065 [Planctomycetaceae bacterium]